MLRLGCEDLYLVSALQLMAQGDELVVHFRPYAVCAEECVYEEGEVEHGASGRHGLYLPFGREHEYLACEEVQFDGVEEVHGVRLRVVEYLLYGAQPVVQFVVVVHIDVALLVFPVCCEPLFGNLVHLVAPYLHLNPLSLL